MYLILATSGLFLAACSNGAAELQEDVESVSQIKEELVVSLNEIQSKEASMQEEFDASLVSDEDLVSFKDGSAQLFSNIDSRSEQLASIQKLLKDLEKETSRLNKQDDEELPLTAVQTLSQTVTDIQTTLTDYVETYDNQLAEEKTTFESFGSDDADFNTLYNGIDRLNATSHANLEKIQPLVDLLASFDSQFEELMAELTALQDK